MITGRRRWVPSRPPSPHRAPSSFSSLTLLVRELDDEDRVAGRDSRRT
jgi:hypothetical protein